MLRAFAGPAPRSGAEAQATEPGRRQGNHRVCPSGNSARGTLIETGAAKPIGRNLANQCPVCGDQAQECQALKRIPVDARQPRKPQTSGEDSDRSELLVEKFRSAEHFAEHGRRRASEIKDLDRRRAWHVPESSRRQGAAPRQVRGGRRESPGGKNPEAGAGSP